MSESGNQENGRANGAWSIANAAIRAIAAAATGAAIPTPQQPKNRIQFENLHHLSRQILGHEFAGADDATYAALVGRLRAMNDRCANAAIAYLEARKAWLQANEQQQGDKTL